MLNRFVLPLVVVGAITVPAATASAALITFDVCYFGSCQAFGGNVPTELTLLGSDLQIVATNNLTTGYVTSLKYTMPVRPFPFLTAATLISATSMGGNGVRFDHLSIQTTGRSIVITDLTWTDWAPGETIVLLIDTTPDLTVGDLVFRDGIGFLTSAEIRNACNLAHNIECQPGAGGGLSFLLRGETPPNTSVPEPASVLLLGLGALLGVRRRQFRTH